MSYEKQTTFVNNLPYDIKKSLNWYTQEYYEDINSFLRTGRYDTSPDGPSREEIEENIKNIDIAFSSAPPLDHSISVYRGQKKHIYNTKAYTSTSSFIKSTSDFVNKYEGCCVYEITVLPGSKILPVKVLSDFQYEEEIIINRGGTLELVHSSHQYVDYGGVETYMKVYHMIYKPEITQVIDSENDIGVFETKKNILNDIETADIIKLIVSGVRSGVEETEILSDTVIDTTNINDPELINIVRTEYNRVRESITKLPPFDNDIYLLIVEELNA